MTTHEPAAHSAEVAADKPNHERPPAEEPDQADPAQADPAQADPAQADPAPTDPEPEGGAPDEVEPEDAEPEGDEPEDVEPEDVEPEDAGPESAGPAETGPDEADSEEAEAEIEPAAGEDTDDRQIEVIGGGDYPDEDEELPPVGFDKRPDVRTWILVPVATLILGPAIAASVMFFVAVSTKGYPSICPSVRVENGCENSILRMADQHTVAFLGGWLLLWALPWWRGLRAYRIGFAVVLALVLVAIPLRLIHTISLGADV